MPRRSLYKPGRSAVGTRSVTVRRFKVSKVGFIKVRGNRCGCCGGDGLNLDSTAPCARCNGRGSTLS